MGKEFCKSCGLQKTVWVRLNQNSLCNSCAAAQGRARNGLYSLCKSDSKVTVSENSLLVVNHGKEITIPISNIQEFQLDPPQNYSSGVIRIKTARSAGTSLNIGLGLSLHDSSITLYPTENCEFAEAKKISNYIAHYSSNPSPSGISTSSAADEIRKFQELLKDGIISQEEFDQKKKQLLGL